MVQHLAMFDFIAVSGSGDGRPIEYIDHPHDRFTDPVVVQRGRYRAPVRPGFSTQMTEAAVAEHRFGAA